MKYILFAAFVALGFSFNLHEEHTVNGIDDKCVQDHCPDQVAACKADPKCQPTINKCQSKCGTSTSCWKQCLFS